MHSTYPKTLRSWKVNLIDLTQDHYCLSGSRKAIFAESGGEYEQTACVLFLIECVSLCGNCISLTQQVKTLPRCGGWCTGKRAAKDFAATRGFESTMPTHTRSAQNNQRGLTADAYSPLESLITQLCRWATWTHAESHAPTPPPPPTISTHTHTDVGTHIDNEAHFNYKTKCWTTEHRSR